MTKVTINTTDPVSWDRFVRSAEGSTYAHLYGWKWVVEQSYGNPCFYFEAWDGDKLKGVLPTAFLSSRLFGRQLVSLPYLDTGGPLFTDPLMCRALIAAVREKADELNADICLRSMDEGICDWQKQLSKVTMYLPLNSNSDDMLKSFPSERRNRIRKAIKNGLSATFYREDGLDVFYGIFSENMRDLGSPVHSKRFFREVLAAFPEQTGIVIVWGPGSRAIGAGLYFRFNDIMALPWVSSLRGSFKLNPNIILYWELMKMGIENGARTFDFGRSNIDSGTFEYKRQWGSERVPLYWYVYSENGNGSVEAIDTASRKNQAMMSLWKKLPLGVANAIGPMLRKSISL